MTRSRQWLATLVVVVLVAAGCGGGEDKTNVTTIGVLSAALADTAEASTYRVSLFVGSTFALPAMGFESETGIDGQGPTMVGEISTEREHLVMDIGTMLEGLLGDIGDLGDLRLETWVDGEWIVMDTSSYQRLADANPEVDLGPIAPGVFSIDLAAIGAESPELLRALVGSSTPDLNELAVSLPTALREIEQTSTSPQIFVGTAIYADLLAAQGVDVIDSARSQAAGQALAQPISVDALTDFYVDFFENLDAEVVIELDERGLLRVFTTRADMSDIFSKMLDAEGLLPETSEQGRREATEMFKDAVLVLETRSVYEADINLEVPLPPETTEDRTEQWRQFLIDAGFTG